MKPKYLIEILGYPRHYWIRIRIRANGKIIFVGEIYTQIYPALKLAKSFGCDLVRSKIVSKVKNKKIV